MPVLEQMPQSIDIAMPFSAPSISDEVLNTLTDRIKPVVLRGRRLFYIEPVDPRKIAFNWDPTLAMEAIDLEEVATITTLHSTASSVFFKVSIADVLAQIPVGYTDQIVAFRTEHNDESMSNWSRPELLARMWGFHLGVTTLYKLA